MQNIPNNWKNFMDILNKYSVDRPELQAELSARYGKNNNVGVISGGGRLGAHVPINRDQSVGLGLSGGGFRAKGNTPYGRVNERDFAVDNLDLMYTKGVNTFRGGMGINNPNWNFTYERKF